MTIKSKKEMSRGIEIDTTGPAGNAYALIGTAMDYAKQLGRDPDAIAERMKSGDYDNLLRVFDEELGEYITLITN
jgi:hypothetical protein